MTASFRSLPASPRIRPILLLLCLGLVWGIHWPVTKIGLRDLPPFTYGALRVATGLAVVVGVLAARRGLSFPDRRDFPVVASVGLGQMAFGIAAMNLALPLVAAGRSSILVYTMPLWVGLFQLSSLRTGARQQVLGLLIGLSGIGLLLSPQSIDWGSQGQLAGSAVLLASAAVWAATTIHLRQHEWHGTPFNLMPWQLIVALVPLAVLAVVIEGGRSIHWEPTAIAAVIYSGPLATALAFWLTQSVSRSLSPLATTMGFLTVPVVGLVASWVMLGEPLTMLDFAGALATMAGIVVVSASSRDRRRDANLSSPS
ncbi:MAG TPA: DMT family transporter [Candidatus Limnocylindrales bacterium]